MMKLHRLACALALGACVASPALSQGAPDAAAQNLRESAQRVDALLRAEEARLEAKLRQEQREASGKPEAPKAAAAPEDVFEVLAIYGTPGDMKMDLLVNGLPSFALQKGDPVRGWRVGEISVQTSCATLERDGKGTAKRKGAARKLTKSLCWDGHALASRLSPPPAPAAAAGATGTLPPLPPPVSSALPAGAPEPTAGVAPAQPAAN